MYNKLINNIIRNRIFISIIIDFDEASNNNIQVYKKIVKDIIKYKKNVLINCGNNKTYFHLNDKFYLNYFNGLKHADIIYKNIDINKTNILVFKNYKFLPEKINAMSTIILNIKKSGYLTILKNRYDSTDFDGIEIDKFLRKEKIKKLNK